MPQIRDQHPRGKIEKSSAFRSPMEDAGAAIQNRLGRSVSAERARLVRFDLIPAFVGGGFVGMMQRVFHGLNAILIENSWFRLAGEAQHQASEWAIDFRNPARLTLCMAFQDRFHRLDHRHRIPIG